MKQILFFILLNVLMANLCRSQNQHTGFFNAGDSVKYKVTFSLEHPSSASHKPCLADEADAKQLIGLMSKLSFEETLGKGGDVIIDFNATTRPSRSYCINIQHPNGNHLSLFFSGLGISKGVMFITKASGEIYGRAKLLEPLSKEGFKALVGLYCRYIKDFQNIRPIEGARIKISPALLTSFATELSEEDSRKYIELYNTALDGSYATHNQFNLVGGQSYIISYGGSVINEQSGGHRHKRLFFSDENNLKIEQMVKDTLQTFSGEYRIEDSHSVAVYNYLRGELDGTSFRYSPSGDLLGRDVYTKNWLIYSARYEENRLAFEQFSVRGSLGNERYFWIEYAQDGTKQTEGISEFEVSRLRNFKDERSLIYQKSYKGQSPTIKVKTESGEVVRLD